LKNILPNFIYFSVTVYDVSNRETFDQLDNWFNELSTYCTNKDVVKMIVGNKVDKVLFNRIAIFLFLRFINNDY
jgi:GTPase SAR1 family protein